MSRTPTRPGLWRAQSSRRAATALAAALALAWAAAPAPAADANAALPELRNASVSIPWKELRELLEATRKPGPDAPPVSHVFSPAEYAATIAEGAVRITARCDLDVLADRWTLISLGCPSAALRKVTLDGKPCPVVLKDNLLHALVLDKGLRKLEMQLEDRIAADKGAERFTVPLLPSPIITLTTTIGRAGLEVQAAGASSLRTEEKAGQTVILTSHRGGTAATISWSPRPIRPAAMPARIYAETEMLISLDDGLARTTADVRLQVLHSPLEKLRLLVDGKAAVLSASGEGVAGWTVAEAKAPKGAKAVEVAFSPAALGDRTVRLVMEHELPAGGGELAIAAIGVEGAKRDRGTVAVACRGGWEVKAGQAAGAERIGVSQLPAALRGQGAAGLELAYRYGQTPASIALTAARPRQLPAKLYAQTATLATVEPARVLCRSHVQYQVLQAGVDSLRVELPEGAELLEAAAPALRHTQVVQEGTKRLLVADLKDLARGSFELTVVYERRLRDGEKVAAVPLVAHPGAVEDRGSVGIEVRGGLEVRAEPKGAERIDVKELSGAVWGAARSPLLMAFQYARMPAEIALSITRHRDAEVLVAMSDVCEAATTVTADGKAITKLMFILRNNLKQFMTLKMPEGAEVWSAFVNDQPVTPVITDKGELLVPLVKSEPEEEGGDDDDEDGRASYAERRDRRRREGPGDKLQKATVLRQTMKKLRPATEAGGDLKPYDVEIVFITPKVKLEDRGELKLALPQSDIPTGHAAWAVFLPQHLRLVDAVGNCREVGSFSLPFRHFADAEYQRRFALQAAKVEALQQAQQELTKAMDQVADLARAAKAQGVLPVRIEIPITGQISRYEKLLVVDEAPAMTVTYRKKVE